MRIFVIREKLNLFSINLLSMPYFGRNEYNLIELDKKKTN